MQTAGRVLISLGTILLVVGILLFFGNKIGLGTFPGDIYMKRGNQTLFFPVTSILLTIIIVTLVSYALNLAFKR